jgi:serine protease Do
MNRNYSHFDILTALLTGTTAALTITISQPAHAKTPQEVASIAGPLTVQVNSSLGDGSGAIIAKNGNTYTVLTLNTQFARRKAKTIQQPPSPACSQQKPTRI